MPSTPGACMPVILGLRKAGHKEDHKEETILDYILIIRLKNLKQQTSKFCHKPVLLELL